MLRGVFVARRKCRAVWRSAREWRMLFRALASRDHPVLAHLIPIRRCNLSCAYCSEYDRVSPPVPLGALLSRVDRLADLGLSILTLSGGEPLLHPDLDAVIAHARRRGLIAGLITNGYLLTRVRIERLNRAGLDHLQISIDNVEPDEVSKKSLKVLDRKLMLLAEHALFHVNINSVVGGGIRNAADALTIARRAHALGFSSTVGIIHDSRGQLKPLGAEEQRVYRELRRLADRGYGAYAKFQDAVAAGQPHRWRCRAGSRYLYVCEDGLVHYCSQQRGYPAKPLAEYGVDDIRREFHSAKSCAPVCTVSCVHMVSLIDHWRPAPSTPLVQIQVEE